MTLPFYCNEAERKFLDQLFALAIETRKELLAKDLPYSKPILIRNIKLFDLEMDIVFHRVDVKK